MAVDPAEPRSLEDAGDELRVPLVAERLVVSKRLVETGRVRVQVAVEERQEPFELDLERQEVEVRRVPVGRPVEAVPETRREGDTLIVPVVEEELVLTKRLVLREEIHVTRRAVRRTEGDTVTLRAERATVTRVDGEGQQAGTDAGPVAGETNIGRTEP